MRVEHTEVYLRSLNALKHRLVSKHFLPQDMTMHFSLGLLHFSCRFAVSLQSSLPAAGHKASPSRLHVLRSWCMMFLLL